MFQYVDLLLTALKVRTVGKAKDNKWFGIEDVLDKVSYVRKQRTAEVGDNGQGSKHIIRPSVTNLLSDSRLSHKYTLDNDNDFLTKWNGGDNKYLHIYIHLDTAYILDVRKVGPGPINNLFLQHCVHQVTRYQAPKYSMRTKPPLLQPFNVPGPGTYKNERVVLNKPTIVEKTFGHRHSEFAGSMVNKVFPRCRPV